jgi:phosphatidylglycerophosphate synthase
VARGGSALPDRDQYLTLWASLHGGYDPRRSFLVGTWLRGTYAIARLLVRLRVSPTAVTVIGVLLAAGSAGATAAGWLGVAVFLVAASGIADSLDGAVALLSGRATAFGAVLDSVCDRIADLSYVLALYWAGAPLAVCLAGGVLAFVHEYARARATALGMSDIGVVTVWERPTRVIVTAMFLLGSALWVSGSARLAHKWAAAGAWVWLILGVVGLGQLVFVVRQRLRDD